MSPPTPDEPLVLRCRCGGVPGCASCSGSGSIVEITSCPLSHCESVLSVAPLIEHARKGSWPNAGGMLDQPHAFVEAAEHWWSEESRWQSDQA